MAWKHTWKRDRASGTTVHMLFIAAQASPFERPRVQWWGASRQADRKRSWSAGAPWRKKTSAIKGGAWSWLVRSYPANPLAPGPILGRQPPQWALAAEASRRVLPRPSAGNRGQAPTWPVGFNSHTKKASLFMGGAL